MKRKLFYTLLFSSAILTGCSGNDDTSANSNDKIIGTWESWKEVTDNGETFPLDEYDCPLYVEVYNTNGIGTEKEYFHMNNECEQIYSVNISWSNQGNDNYKISGGGLSATHQYTFVDNDTYYQRDEDNESNIYFKRKVQ